MIASRDRSLVAAGAHYVASRMSALAGDFWEPTDVIRLSVSATCVRPIDRDSARTDPAGGRADVEQVSVKNKIKTSQSTDRRMRSESTYPRFTAGARLTYGAHAAD